MKLSWTNLYELETLYGDAFYLLDLEMFAENYHEFLDAFRSIYPHSNIAYSYKTNYTPKLCQAVDAMGGYAEVVSIMEYDLALRIGVKPSRIIFNGPYKREEEIEKALLAGSIVNLDSFSEVELVQAIANRNPKQSMTVGLRCNLALSPSEISRFGFDVDSEEFNTAFATLKALANCEIGGFHCHVSTSDKSLESYALRAKKMLALSATYFPGKVPKFVNLGGGYFSKMSLEFRKQFSVPIPTYQEYATAIASPFQEAFSGTEKPELILEPGTAITANIMQFVAKVIYLKTVQNRTVALSSGSIHNIKPTLHKKNLPMSIISSPGNQAKEQPKNAIDIVGYTCMEHDCLYQGYTGALTVDDYLIFDNVGSYTTVMKPPFICPCPPMLSYDLSSQKFQVIKRQEELADVFSTYIF